MSMPDQKKLLRLQGLACLAKVVAQNQDLAGVRPSLMAASLLVADRQAAGELPAWPSCLARLTGYTPAHLQDLAGAHLPVLRCGLHTTLPSMCMAEAHGQGVPACTEDTM